MISTFKAFNSETGLQKDLVCLLGSWSNKISVVLPVWNPGHANAASTIIIQ